jgi:hypothetical protein
MDLTTRFRITASSKVVKITSLTRDFLYPIELAEKIQTHFGKVVLLTLQQQTHLSCVKVFLPRRYGALFTEAHLTSINEKCVALALRYGGTCPTSNSYILEIV